MKQFQCTQCRHAFEAPDWLGAAAACPKCGAKSSSAIAEGHKQPIYVLKTAHEMLLSKLLSWINQNRRVVVGLLAAAALLLLVVVFVGWQGKGVGEPESSSLQQTETISGGSVREDNNVYDVALQSTVWIVCEHDNDEFSTGTGSIVDGHSKVVLTNYHVVKGAKGIFVYAPAYDSDGRVIADESHYLQVQQPKSARVRASDPRRDLAVLTLAKPLRGVKGINFSARSARPGQNVHTIGNSGEDIEGGLWVYTSGTVRQVYVHASGVKIIETQNPINSGDSGGPVVGDDGKLVAVTMSYMPGQRLVTRAIDVEEVKKFVDAFRDR